MLCHQSLYYITYLLIGNTKLLCFWHICFGEIFHSLLSNFIWIFISKALHILSSFSCSHSPFASSLHPLSPILFSPTYFWEENISSYYLRVNKAYSKKGTADLCSTSTVLSVYTLPILNYSKLTILLVTKIEMSDVEWYYC